MRWSSSSSFRSRLSRTTRHANEQVNSQLDNEDNQQSQHWNVSSLIDSHVAKNMFALLMYFVGHPQHHNNNNNININGEELPSCPPDPIMSGVQKFLITVMLIS